jgi:hypothetical protein
VDEKKRACSDRDGRQWVPTSVASFQLQVYGGELCDVGSDLQLHGFTVCTRGLFSDTPAADCSPDSQRVYYRVRLLGDLGVCFLKIYYLCKIFPNKKLALLQRVPGKYRGISNIPYDLYNDRSVHSLAAVGNENPGRVWAGFDIAQFLPAWQV